MKKFLLLGMMLFGLLGVINAQDGSINLQLGTLGGSFQKGFDIAFSDSYKQYDVAMGACPTNAASSENNVHLLFQCSKFIGKISIQKVEI